MKHLFWWWRNNNIKRGVCNLWYWLPIIWRDRNWDYCFLVDMLSHKVAAMHSELAWYQKQKSWSLHKNHLQRLTVARLLLNRLRHGEQWYFENALVPVEQRWGVPGRVFVDYDRWTFPKADAEHQLVARREYRAALEQAHKHYAADWTFLWDLLKRYLEFWWD